MGTYDIRMPMHAEANSWQYEECTKWRLTGQEQHFLATSATSNWGQPKQQHVSKSICENNSAPPTLSSQIGVGKRGLLEIRSGNNDLVQSKRGFKIGSFLLITMSVPQPTFLFSDSGSGQEVCFSKSSPILEGTLGNRMGPGRAGMDTRDLDGPEHCKTKHMAKPRIGPRRGSGWHPQRQ